MARREIERNDGRRARNDLFDDFFSFPSSMIQFPSSSLHSVFSDFPMATSNNIGNSTSHVSMMSSVTGPDGQTHTEHYHSSSVKDSSRGIRESRQEYSNSKTGIEKEAHERLLGQKGRKNVKETNKFTEEEKETEFFKGIDESNVDQFETEWRTDAAPHIHLDWEGGRQHRRNLLGDTEWRVGRSGAGNSSSASAPKQQTPSRRRMIGQ